MQILRKGSPALVTAKYSGDSGMVSQHSIILKPRSMTASKGSEINQHFHPKPLNQGCQNALW
jgi:hypothetical protein